LFGVTETLLTATILSSFVNIYGYCFERKDRVNNGGGTGVYIKNGSSYNRREDLEKSEVEGIWLEILIKHSN